MTEFNTITLSDIESIYNSQQSIMIVNNNKSKTILFIGSCRIHVFLNYFINDPYFGNNYNYLCILVYTPQMQNIHKTIMENEPLKNMIRQSSILIGEYIQSYGYFNTNRNTENNIFDIHNGFENVYILPNFMYPLIYSKDIIRYGNSHIKNTYKMYLNDEISFDLFSNELVEYQKNEIDKLCRVFVTSGYPKLVDYVKNTIHHIRLAHTYNHPSNAFFIELYRLFLLKHFDRNVPDSVIMCNNKGEYISSVGYSTILTWYDKVCLNLQINEPYYDKIKSDLYLLSDDIFYRPI